MNKETLEEAACKALGYDYNDWVSLFSKDKSTVIYSEVINWCKGAKYMAERMYSEEDLKQAMITVIVSDSIKNSKDIAEYIQQLKK